MQSIWQAELNVRQAENAVLDTAQARLELQALTGRLADQQQHLGAMRRKQELQGCLHMSSTAVTLSKRSVAIAPVSNEQLVDLPIQRCKIYHL